MKVVILEHARNAHMPIMQLGGAVLHMGEQILVRADLAKAILRESNWLKQVGETEVQSLRQGVWEIKKAGQATEAKATAEAPAGVTSDPAPANRDMAGVGKGRMKKKG